MIQRTDFEDYVAAVDALKKKHGRVFTNMFLSPEKIRKSLNTKRCLCFRTEDVLLLAVPAHNTFLKLHFFAKDVEYLREGILKFEREYDKRLPLVCEIIGREDFVKENASALEPIGFSLRKRIRRMNLSGSDALPKEMEDLDVNGVRFAKKEDAVEVLDLFQECFDLYGDGLPELSELEESIAKKQVVLTRRDGRVVAAQYFEINGKTLHGWFDCTKKEYRKQFVFFEIQLFLTRHFRDIGFRPNRIVGWRDIDNQRLMKMALLNHEIPEDMVDYIMMKSYDVSSQKGDVASC